MTEFRSIGGSPDYRVSSDGVIQSRRRRRDWRDLRPATTRGGYKTLVVDGKSTSVHREVAKAFIPNPLGLPCVRHLDGNPANNSVSNLAWGTYLDNEEDKRRHGTYENRLGGAKLTPEMVAVAKTLRASGARHVDIARIFKVHPSVISRAVRGESWRAV